MTVKVRRIDASDMNRWKSLYANYREFYKLPEQDSAVDTTWQWVIGGEHEFMGIVAVDMNDAPVAFTNLRWFARPSTATVGLYLDDLFTSQDARATGAGSAQKLAGSPTT